MKHVLPFVLLLLHLPLMSQWQGVTPNIPDTVGCVKVYGVNDQVAWAVSQRYAVLDSFYDRPDRLSTWWLKTVDGGQTWTGDSAPNIGGEPFIFNVSALDANTAWVVGIELLSFTPYCFQTTDGGVTWTSYLDTLFNTPGGYLNQVHFWDAQNGIVFGDPSHGKNDTIYSFEIQHTTDSGKTWTRVPRANLPDPQPNEYGGAYNVLGDRIWFFTSNGRIYRSADRGHTWAVSGETGYFGVVNTIAFADSMVGIFGGFDWPNNSIGLFISMDGGATWVDKTPADSSYLVTGLDIVPGTRVIVLDIRNSNTVGPFYTWASYDLGESWVQIGSGENAGWCDFLDENTGYAGEWMNLSRKGKMYTYEGSPLLGLFGHRELDLNFTLGPNPARDVVQLSLQAPQPGRYAIQVNDSRGRLLSRQLTDFVTDWDTELDLSTYPAGVYTITISNDLGKTSRKVVKE
jgi:hypothetical protein